MPLNWDDEEDDEATALEYRKPRQKILVHEEVTTPLSAEPSPGKAEKNRGPVYSAPAPLELAPGLIFAPLKDRFVAFFIDSLFGFYSYWILGALFIKIYHVPSLKALHQYPTQFWIHILSTLAITFLYYFFMESSSGATWGKKICKLQVLEENGRKPSMGNVFIRNILRVFDYPFAFIVAVIMMESSASHQRLGDRAARTMVVKKTGRPVYPYDLQHTPLASSFSRLLSGVIDLFLVSTLLYSVLLIPSAKKPLLFFVTLLSLPLLFIFYFALLETFSETTPGKALLGRKVVQNTGEKIHFPSAFLRNFWKPLDYFIGYPLMVLGVRKQRLGDLASDTLVIAQRSPKKSLIGIAVALLLILTTSIFGFRNPDSFVRLYYQSSPIEGIRYLLPSLWQRFQGKAVNFRPQEINPHEITSPEKKSAQPPALNTSKLLQIQEFFFAAGPGKTREKARFSRGEPVFLMFKISGFARNEASKATYRQELTLEDASGQVIQGPDILVRRSDNLQENQPVLFSNHVKIPSDASGRFRALIKVTDETNQETLVFEKFFEVE